MREILFRGKDKDTGEWEYGSLDVYGEYYEIRNDAINSVIPETVGQFTGLSDKNGKKIFEGDILNCADRLVYVKWHDKCGCWDSEFICYKGSLCSNGIQVVEWKFRSEIIGNLFDNPELLEGK